MIDEITVEKTLTPIQIAQQELGTPDLLIRMTSTYRGLAEGATLGLPRDVAINLIRMRKAVPTGSFQVYADVVLDTEAELAAARIVHLQRDRTCHQ